MMMMLLVPEMAMSLHWMCLVDHVRDSTVWFG